MTTVVAPRLELCQATLSQLLVVDVQERLCAAIPEDCLERSFANIARISQAAQRLGIPIIATEQYPQGLGPTHPRVRSSLPEGLDIPHKTSFSCCGTQGFEHRLLDEAQRPQVILAGLEAHICVLQTAAGLQQWGYRVFVVADAICSRNPQHRDNALNRMRQGGIQITNTESLVFEWLGGSEHAQFRELSRLFR